MSDMTVSVLIDNAAREGLQPEWGLALHIAYRGREILLDGGASGAFADNAKKMGIDLCAVDTAVLSHAHYDHADGLEAFMEANPAAKLYVQTCAGENCYDCGGEKPRYIGIRPGFLGRYAGRIVRVSGDCSLGPGVRLVSHRTPGLEELGRQMSMYLDVDGTFFPDAFAHEQSLVFDTAAGLVIFNSCCHGGAGTVIREAAAAYPERKLCALIGGLHLFKASDEEIADTAAAIRSSDVEKVYTGHCTGEHALGVLRQQLGDTVVPIEAGMRIAIG